MFTLEEIEKILRLGPHKISIYEVEYFSDTAATIYIGLDRGTSSKLEATKNFCLYLSEVELTSKFDFNAWSPWLCGIYMQVSPKN